MKTFKALTHSQSAELQKKIDELSFSISMEKTAGELMSLDSATYRALLMESIQVQQANIRLLSAFKDYLKQISIRVFPTGMIDMPTNLELSEHEITLRESVKSTLKTMNAITDSIPDKDPTLFVHQLELGAGNITVCGEEFGMEQRGIWDLMFTLDPRAANCPHCINGAAASAG